ncbi:hypothetical protein HFX_1499 [Haloferax mediterranei ATCC 33500]|uniref:C2H2-type domain-containing protein n=1 Tax=Haloferax mediterranei (strain ATCC 33500 / DSM 1411 / JCM 8866 / NBRC 14739 / NCIMB 2177 / R-4) TaxID=523841 RepID=I3R4P7_HALMT|nr:hypothetical protein HFX_1499 [Haloferax mediterranei ATCC 33500]
MAPLKLPVQRVLQETRLHYDLKRVGMWRCSKCNVVVHSAEWYAYHLVKEHAFDNPESADAVIHVEDYSNQSYGGVNYPHR